MHGTFIRTYYVVSYAWTLEATPRAPRDDDITVAGASKLGVA